LDGNIMRFIAVMLVNGELSGDWLARLVLMVLTAVLANVVFGRQRPVFGAYYVVRHTF